MMTTESIRHKIVFKESPSDIKMKAIKAKMMVPVEKPIILIGHIFSPKSSNTIFDAVMAK
tara:strand:- start:494 stop:673 length:180 start_codon:yes stop_codon:yes gene_type:complete